jgi:hypothetical protein
VIHAAPLVLANARAFAERERFRVTILRAYGKCARVCEI